MNMKRKKTPRWLPYLLLIFAFSLAACGGADTSALESSPSELATQSAELQQSVATPTNMPPTVEGGDTEPVENPASPAELPAIPRIDKGSAWFEPANPIGVVLASGELQIIEFSAYW